MSRKFVLAIDDLSDKQEDELISYLNDSEFNWWHWIGDLWLVIDNSDSYDETRLRDIISEDLGMRTTILVMFVKDTTAVKLSGLVPTEHKAEITDWIQNKWLESESLEEK